MSLLGLVVFLVIIGIMLYLINKYIPMDDKIKLILNVVVVIAVCIWVLDIFGLLGAFDVPIPRYHR